MSAMTMDCLGALNGTTKTVTCQRTTLLHLVQSSNREEACKDFTCNLWRKTCLVFFQFFALGHSELITRRQIEDFELVAGEATANCIIHASEGSVSKFDILISSNLFLIRAENCPRIKTEKEREDEKRRDQYECFNRGCTVIGKLAESIQSEFDKFDPGKVKVYSHPPFEGECWRTYFYIRIL